jgi:hypothetical protein
LAAAIVRAEDFDHREVQAIAQQRFDPMRHFKAISARSC